MDEGRRVTEAHGTVADVGDDVVIYMRRTGQWACLACSRVNGECTGERRE
jgi:hypothetical protein